MQTSDDDDDDDGISQFETTMIAERILRPLRVHVAACNLGDPISVDEALARSNSAQWKSAMRSEFDSLIENNT